MPGGAVDPVDGGGKVTAQGAALGWPVLAAEDAVDAELLDARLKWCLSGQAAVDPPVPSLAGFVEALVGER
ncbi:hypothetical protein [Amycolatopsis solani]|uniref:hypothetical protein n=1 Tax=Amycolatopsis solani TaxID=3028615 RepID=UPI003F6934B5